MKINRNRVKIALLVLSTLVVFPVRSALGESKPDLDWCDLQELKATYEEVKETSAAAYVHQYLCMLERSCREYEENGSEGWADGFVRSTFSYQRSLTEVQRGVDVSCPSSYSSSQCFKSASGVHGFCELSPSFTNYCDEIADLDAADYDDAVERWTDDHELFLENAFDPCFDDVIESGELPRDDGKKLKDAYESLAVTARKAALLYCDKKTSGWGFLGDALAIVESANDAVLCKK